jgi:hypothetical protein
MIRRLVMAAVLASSTAAAGLAATQATLILNSGERHTGTLVYHKDANFAVLENGQERSFPQSQVAVIDFAGGTPSADELSKLPTNTSAELERNAVILRSGSVVVGKLYDIKDDSITIDTREGQRRDIAISEVSRIYSNPTAAASLFKNPAATTNAATPTATTGTVPGAVMVEANKQWTDTGITVRKGDRVAFQTTGTIKFGTADDMSAPPDGSPAANAPRGPQFPVPAVPVGALIFKVGTGAASPIGSNSQPITMPADGRLYLGVNDDNYSDNSGAFAVVITPQARRR